MDDQFRRLFHVGRIDRFEAVAGLKRHPADFADDEGAVAAESIVKNSESIG